MRKTLAELHDEAATTDERGQLIVDGCVVALAYFRAGYNPRDYPSEKEWAALLQIERSLAVKCPTVAYHLAGCKRMQQVLSSAGMLERFISADDAVLARSSFTSLWLWTRERTRRAAASRLLSPTRHPSC